MADPVYIKISELTEATLPLDGTEDIEIVQGAVTRRCSTQDIADLISVSGEVLTAKITVSSAEILALNSSPKVLVAAPGAGKILVPLAVTFKLNFGTTPYTTNLNLRVREGFTLTQNAGVLGLSGNAFSLQPLAGGVQSADITNTALTLDVATGNPNAGDGTLIVYVTYTAVTV